MSNENLVDFEVFVFGSGAEFKVGVDTATVSSSQQSQTPTGHNWIREKIAAWDDPIPQTRTKCVKYARTDFPPAKWCVGWKTETRKYRNEVWLTVSSPTFKDLQKAVERALSDAVVVAAIVAIATSGAAAVAAFERVFTIRLTQEVKDAVVNVSTTGSWGSWG